MIDLTQEPSSAPTEEKHEIHLSYWSPEPWRRDRLLKLLNLLNKRVSNAIHAVQDVDGQLEVEWLYFSGEHETLVIDAIWTRVFAQPGPVTHKFHHG